jgi:hypothetical protein
MKQKAKLVLVSFAEGRKFQRKRAIQLLSARLFCRFDKVYKFSFDDIDYSFLKCNSSIFNIRLGLGMWLWKPYFINKVLDELQEGDILFYCDSSSLFIRDSCQLISSFISSGQSVMTFELPLKEIEFTSDYVLKFMDFENSKYLLTNQISASVFLIKKDDFILCKSTACICLK